MPRKRKHALQGRQCAALAFALEEGETKILLVTSRETHRWVLPKGWTEKHLAPHEAAAKEAFEEAGIMGEIGDTPIGSYAYMKRISDGCSIACEVDVFPMQVQHLLDDWPEKAQRERRWFTLPEAAMAVEEGELVTLLLRLAAPQP